MEADTTCCVESRASELVAHRPPVWSSSFRFVWRRFASTLRMQQILSARLPVCDYRIASSARAERRLCNRRRRQAWCNMRASSMASEACCPVEVPLYVVIGRLRHQPHPDQGIASRHHPLPTIQPPAGPSCTSRRFLWIPAPTHARPERSNSSHSTRLSLAFQPLVPVVTDTLCH